MESLNVAIVLIFSHYSHVGILPQLQELPRDDHEGVSGENIYQETGESQRLIRHREIRRDDDDKVGA